jgi:hypothetical protein
MTKRILKCHYKTLLQLRLIVPQLLTFDLDYNGQIIRHLTFLAYEYEPRLELWIQAEMIYSILKISNVIY